MALAFLAPAAASHATEQSEFERFREYILNPEFVDITSVEAALMEEAAGEITRQAKGYISGASSPGSFVFTLVGPTPVQFASLGPIFTDRGRTTSFKPLPFKRRRFAVGLYYSYADFKQFDGHDISSLFKGPVAASTTLTTATDFLGKITGDANYLKQDRRWKRTFQQNLLNGDYATAVKDARTAGIREFLAGNRELVDVKKDQYGRIKTLIFKDTYEHFREVAKATFQIKSQTVTAVASFIATEWLDLTALIPIHSIDWQSDVFREHYVNGALAESTRAHFGDSATGLGDITLRSKSRLTPGKSIIDCAAALDLRLPTGDEDKLLGTGSFGVTPFVMLSKEIPLVGRKEGEEWKPRPAITPYLNVGYLFDTEESDWNRLEVKAALDYTPFPGRLSVGGEFIGLFYDEFKIYDAGVCVKVAPLKGERPLALAASVLFPVNDDGLRPDFVGVFGAEYSF